MQLEQIIYGLFNGRGYRIIKSPGVDKLLSDDSQQRLIKIIENSSSYKTTIPMQFPTENVLTLSRCMQVADEYGRKGVWSHTVLVRASDFVWELKPYLKDVPSEKPPKTLEAINK